MEWVIEAPAIEAPATEAPIVVRTKCLDLLIASKRRKEKYKEKKNMVYKKQSTKDKMDETLGERRGKASSKKQDYTSRRKESTAMKRRKNK